MPWIEHTGDGTLVHDTDRDDTELRQAVKAAGFRWGRSIGAWYLPRPWTFARRSQSVRQLVSAMEQLGRPIEVREQRERTRTTEEIEAERTERAEARAERMTGRAGQAEASSDAHYQRARELGDMIPIGQPILVGHHSEGRHRKHLGKIDAEYSKSFEEHDRAGHYTRRAAAAAETARRHENPAAIVRRLERLEADRRKLQRVIDGTDGPWSKPATGDRLDILRTEAADLDERIAWNRDALAQAEAQRGRLWAQADFRKGDQVKVSGRWYPVLRVNRKTVTVTPLMDMGEDKNRSWTDTVPYDRIKGRRREGVEHVTPPTE
jgi:hypothetical protein